MAANTTDGGVFLVDDDIFTASEAHLMTQEKQSEFQPRQMDEVLYIASVVAQHQLPVDLVNNVLEFAGVLLTFEVETTELRRGRSDMNEDYLQLQVPTAEELEVPPGVVVSKCWLVVADCTSKDQGWATDAREHNGTYRHSSSWCEVAVTSLTAEGERRETARVPFYPNLRTGRKFRHHRKFFGRSSGLVEQVELGSCVSIVLRSQYPGWTNSANYGKLVACFAVELKDNFSFADVQLLSRFAPEESPQEEGTDPSFPCSLQ